MGEVDSERTVLVVYATETGAAQDLAEELGRLCERLRFLVKVSEFNSIRVGELLQYSAVLFVISTTGQGDLPNNAQVFWKRLRSSKLPTGCLSNLRFTSFGLGDSSYPQYNWAHRKLYNRLIQLGAQPFCDRGESDEQHPEGVDGLFLPWVTKLRSKLLKTYPLPHHQSPIPEDVFLEPKWAAIAKSTGLTSDASLYTDLIPVTGAVTATLTENTRLTPAGHWQDVRFFAFDIPQMQYNPGDVLTLYPKNFPEDVEELLALMGWEEDADTPLHFEATQPELNSKSFYPPSPLGTLPDDYSLTLRKLLTNHLDITAIPRRSFFASIAHFTSDEMQKERLLEFTQPDLVDELYDYTTRPRRSILEVLQEFYTVKVPFRWVASVFPIIRGRQFSIASGGLLKTNSLPDRTRVELLVAIVKYRTVIKKIRRGVCTRYMAALPVGAELNVMLVKGGMKARLDHPCVMIGPGTGVAPLRAMIHERLQQQTGEQSLKDFALFFGCRNKDADYFFADQWQKLQLTHKLNVFTAFSRDKTTKVYVQDLIREQATLVYQLLQTGSIYICGSSGKMPQAVREALIEVFESGGNMARAAAEDHLAQLEKSGRYQQETW